MLKFFRKYELEFKILALAAWTLAAIDKIFFDVEEESRNFHLFMGAVMLLLAVFYLFELIDLIKNKRSKSNIEKVE